MDFRKNVRLRDIGRTVGGDRENSSIGFLGSRVIGFVRYGQEKVRHDKDGQ